MRLLTATLLAILCATPAAACELVVEQAWLRPAPPTARMHAAYLTLRNAGEGMCRITGASSAAYEAVSLHRTTMVDGVARMRAVEVLEIAAGETLRMQPGGLHLMLMRPTGEAGAPVRVVLMLDDGSEHGLGLTLGMPTP